MSIATMGALTVSSILLVTACVCSSNGSPKGASDMEPATDSHDISTLLQDFASRDSTLSITVGTEHFRSGRITLEMRSTGGVRVIQLRSGAERVFSAPAGGDDGPALVRAFSDDGIAEVRPLQGARNPGDVPVVIEIRAGVDQRRVVVWHGDRYEVPSIDRLLKRFDATVAAITDGALPHGKPSAP